MATIRITRLAVLAIYCMLTVGFVPTSTGQALPAAYSPARVAAARPLLRWWWPGADVTPAQIDAELDAIRAAGFGGVEISCLPHKLALDPKRYGWASPAWNAAVKHTLQSAKARGLEVDLTIGPAWPAVVPGLSPDSPASEKELVYGTAIVTANGAAQPMVLPQPAVESQRSLSLVAAVAYPVDPGIGGHPDSGTPGIDHRETAGQTRIDPQRALELTGKVTNGRLDWQPSNGRWLLIASWAQSTGQMDNMRKIEGPDAPNLTDPPAFAIDHFGLAGTRAVTDFWDQHLLSAETTDLLRKVHAAIFEDSMELEGEVHWTPTFLEEFKRRRGYSLEPYLPAVFLTPNRPPGWSAQRPKPAPPFTMDADARDRVSADYRQTLSELYISQHVEPLRAWAHGHGLEFRNQPYGPPIDSGAAAAATDIPEGESLGFDNRTDSFRVLAAGRDLAGIRLLSDECCAEFGSGYAMTWHKMLATIHSNFSGGVNRIVVHGSAYADDSIPAHWPGWAPMVPFANLGPGFAEAWGPRIPTWRHLRPINDYLARTQSVLQAGQDQIDLAIYRLAYSTASGFLPNETLAGSGYTFQYVSPALFELPRAQVAQNRLALDGPAYRALVVPDARLATSAALKHIIEFARSGLPVFVLAAEAGKSEDSRESSAARDLLAVSGVHPLASASALVAALRAARIQPDAQVQGGANISSVHRHDQNADYYWLYNDGQGALDTSVSVVGSGELVSLDAVSGTLRTSGQFEERDGRISTPLRLAAKTATTLAVLRGPARLHAVSTTAEEVVSKEDRLFVRSTHAGTFQTALADGRTVSSTIGSLPEPLDLSHSAWHLKVEDWRPGPGATPTRTTRLTSDRVLQGLQPWSQIEGLADTSGVGVYTIEVNLAVGGRYYLDLGSVGDTARVWVNGTEWPDVTGGRIDLAATLRRGKNRLRIEVATTLLNRMRLTQPEFFDSQPRQPYGLIGPVRLIPYGEVPVG